MAMLDNTTHRLKTGDTTRGSTVSVLLTLYCPHIERCRTPQHHKHSYGGNITISPIYCVPVVHEDVGGPDGAGREPEVLHVPVLSLIPPQVVVRPLLEIATLQILVQF